MATKMADGIVVLLPPGPLTDTKSGPQMALTTNATHIAVIHGIRNPLSAPARLAEEDMPHRDLIGATIARTRRFDSADETRTPDKAKVDVVRMGQTSAARLTLEPGWTWADSIKPIAGTDNCKLRHVGICQSGAMHVTHEDGTEQRINAGDAYVIEPGHNARVVSDDAFVGFEFESQSAEVYATS
jgi:hypothetical protein